MAELPSTVLGPGPAGHQFMTQPTPATLYLQVVNFTQTAAAIKRKTTLLLALHRASAGDVRDGLPHHLRPGRRRQGGEDSASDRLQEAAQDALRWQQL